MSVGLTTLTWVSHAYVGPTHAHMGPTCTCIDPRVREKQNIFQKSNDRVMFLIQYLQKDFANSDFWEISILEILNTT